MNNLRLCGVPVSAELLALQLIHLKPAFTAVGFPNLWRCILCHLYKSHITHRAVTRKAQNVRYFDYIIQGWVAYINMQILTGQYPECLIINANETNMDFNPMPRNTLKWIGMILVRLHCNGSSGCCTIMLGVIIKGVKMPPFIIFKGSAMGCIVHEFNNPEY